MLNLIIGAALGWYAHLHYAIEITTLFNKIIGVF